MKATIVLAAVAVFSISNAAPLQQWGEGCSSCGSAWMAVEDVNTNYGQVARTGYNSAVDKFCDAAGGQTLGGRLYLSMATRVWHDWKVDPSTTGTNGYVFFEIHNKKKDDHQVDAVKCKDYLKALAQENQPCFGRKNRDTKGGTWQVGADQGVSYHAIGHDNPPRAEALDKTFIDTQEIVELGNGGKGNTLDPFPTHAFDDVTPLPCHSHNDYTRGKSLFTALTAGCISVEADVYLVNGKLLVGHEYPGPNGPSLEDLYLNPIKKILDERGSMLPKKSDQALTLLIDFKHAPEDTWDLLVNELAPLREAGYLSLTDEAGFKEGKVTIVATGLAVRNVIGSTSSPSVRVSENNPSGAIFVDATLDKDMSSFNISNSFYASASFKDAVQRKKGPIQGTALSKLRAQVELAHAKGLKVRYWDIPDEDQWQQLIDEGIDILNVDHLQNLAKLDFHL